MIAITKAAVALSALVSAGLVSAYDVTGSQVDEQSAAAQVAHRFPHSGETFARIIPTKQPTSDEHKPVAAGNKGDKLPIKGGACASREWPYIDQSCLVSENGAPVRKVSRFVTIERRIGENTSELTRVPVAAVASR